MIRRAAGCGLLLLFTLVLAPAGSLADEHERRVSQAFELLSSGKLAEGRDLLEAAIEQSSALDVATASLLLRLSQAMPAIRRVTFHMAGDAELGQQPHHGGDIDQMGEVGQAKGIRCQQRRRHQWQRRVLRAADRDNPVQRFAAFNSYPVHIIFVRQ